MGTRGFLGWKIDKKITTTYNHFDSYPSDLGNNTLQVLRKELDTITGTLDPSVYTDPEFRQATAELILGAKFRTIRTTTETGRISKSDRARLARHHDGGVSTGKDNYALLRHQQGNLTAMLDDQYALRAHPSWPKESLFCEWGYLVNFDLPTPALEVYKGFRSTSPTDGEWANSRATYENVYGPVPATPENPRGWGVTGRRRSEYFPVQRVAVFPLSDLPETMPDLED